MARRMPGCRSAAGRAGRGPARAARARVRANVCSKSTPRPILGVPWLPVVRRPDRSSGRRPTRAARTTRSRRSARPIRDWFAATFAAPTPAQVEGWAAIAAGHHTLIHAPTGSGKTLAAFLWCLDRLVRDPSPAARPASSPASVRVLYVSPLKALTYDVERNLRAPLAGIALAAARLGTTRPADLGRAADRRHDARRSGASSPAARPTS